MAGIDDEVKAFELLRAMLEANHMNQWVVIHEQKLIDTYDSFEGAADDAVQRFGRGPFLIRQVGALPARLPVSVLYHPPEY